MSVFDYFKMEKQFPPKRRIVLGFHFTKIILALLVIVFLVMIACVKDMCEKRKKKLQGKKRLDYLQANIFDARHH